MRKTGNGVHQNRILELSGGGAPTITSSNAIAFMGSTASPSPKPAGSLLLDLGPEARFFLHVDGRRLFLAAEDVADQLLHLFGRALEGAAQVRFAMRQAPDKVVARLLADHLKPGAVRVDEREALLRLFLGRDEQD